MRVESSRDVMGLIARLLLLLSIVSRILAQECSGSAYFDIVFNDTQIKHVAVNGVNQVSSFSVGKPFTPSTRLPLSTGKKSYYAGEDGVASYWVNKLLFPAGRRGSYSIFVFDMDTGRWSDAEVYCKPVGVAFWYGTELEIVGFCEVNNSSQIPCVPYFKLQLRNGQWTDISGHGLCSYRLSTTNLTNPVILSYVSQYGYSVKLYIAERETGILHEVDLGHQQSECFNIPYLKDRALKIDCLVPIVAKDGSFTGIRIEAFADSSPNSINHVLFSSSTQQFLRTAVQTETTAFDSYSLNYFVSFTASLRTMVISFRNGTTRQYPLAVTINDPVQCENMAGPDSHHLICFNENDLSPVIINTVDGTNQTVPVGDSPVTNLRTLNENSFYALNSHQELSLHTITNSSNVHIGTYTVRSDSNFRLMGFTSNITCNISHVTSSNGTNMTTEVSNTGNETSTTNSPGDIATTMPTNGTSPMTPTISTGTMESTDTTDMSTNKPEETTATSHPSDTSGAKETTNNTDIDSPVGKPDEGPNNNLSTEAWIVVCVLGVVIAVLVVFIIVALLVIWQRHCCTSKHHFQKLALTATVSTEDSNGLQQDDSKDPLSQSVGEDKLQLTPDSKPSLVQRGSSPVGTYSDNKSEQFVTYVDIDHVSTISAQLCSDENTLMPQTPEFRFSPDGTDLNA